ncbi:hypothetical protein LSCM1_03553 [Leishmania martiniquensis]|uniref:Ubiquitin-like domain-containing protein n=1 Tax=Leishmania martiniquensis TaxID=1580590 RepID=A0A836HCX1_9TRYP|nr:hypothetical protein LSCM1_03553 [Leishmania martiniquensis]
MAHLATPPRVSARGRRPPRPRTSLRIRNVAAGVIYHLVFEGDLHRLSGKQLRHHLARISHVPPAEQQLFVHGQSFAPHVVGAAVGLHEDDVVDFVQTTADVRDYDGRDSCSGGNSIGAASSLRPSTDAGTLSPLMPWQGSAIPQGVKTMRREGNASSASVAMAPTAAASPCRAPSPDRLVGASSPAVQGDRGQATTGANLVYEPHAGPLPQERRPAPLSDSSLPLWATATTLSSLPSGNGLNSRSGAAESPRPQMPAQFYSYPAEGYPQASGPPHAHRPLSPLPSRSLARPSASQSDRRQQSSYEVRSPPLSISQWSRAPLAPLSPLSASAPATPEMTSRHGVYAAPAAGLNYSHYDDNRSHFREQVSRDLSPSQRAQPPPQHQAYRPPVTATALQDEPASLVPAPVARGAVISADEIETILDEEEYVWQMEEYRFRTERQNRLTALQRRQRELALESTRYDQAMAEVERQLARERRKLNDLQRAMSHNATTPSPLDHEQGLPEPPAVTSYSIAAHHDQESDDAHNGAYGPSRFHIGASSSVSVMDEEEVMADV